MTIPNGTDLRRAAGIRGPFRKILRLAAELRSLRLSRNPGFDGLSFGARNADSLLNSEHLALNQCHS